MNEFESPSGDPAMEEIRSELQTLRVLIAVILVMLIGFSIGADYFLSKQVNFQAAEINQLQMVIRAFPQGPANDFLKRLQDYAKTHPDFGPVAAKYPGLFGQPPPATKK